MKNFAKRFSAMFLSLALVLTMMPLLAFAEGEGSDKAFDVAVNGTVVGSIDKSWMEKNKMDPQVFPFVGQKSGAFTYTIAEGPTYESVLKEALEIESIDDIRNAELQWIAEGGQPANKFTLSVKDLKLATANFKLTNGSDDNEIETNLSNESNLYAVQREEEGFKTVTPIIACAEQEKLSFAAAREVNMETWEPTAHDIRAYVGGIIRDEDVWLKKDGDVQNGKPFNFVGKFSIANPSQLNILIEKPKEVEKGSITMKVGDPAKTIETKYSDYEISTLYGSEANQIFECDNAEVVNINDGFGLLKPLSAGIAKVTLKVYVGQSTEPVAELGEWTVTVEKATASTIVNGQTAKSGGNTYKVLDAKAKTAVFTKSANKKSVAVPNTVSINGETLKVTEVGAKAFTGKKIRTVTIGANVKKIVKNAFKSSKTTKMIVKSKGLTKASVKGSLKGSKIKTVQVKVGKKKDNKKFVKKYKKIFTKKNAGKKAKVK